MAPPPGAPALISSSVLPIKRIHGLRKIAEYQMPPSTKIRTPATSTARRFTCGIDIGTSLRQEIGRVRRRSSHGPVRWQSATELTKVVVQVLGHHPPPLVPAEPSEERVGLAGGVVRAALREAGDGRDEARLLGREIAGIGDNEGRIRRGVARKRRRTEQLAAHHPAEQLADERLLAWCVASAHLERGGAVAEHLRGVHLAPLARARRVEAVEPFEDCLTRVAVEEVLHEPSLVTV